MLILDCYIVTFPDRDLIEVIMQFTCSAALDTCFKKTGGEVSDHAQFNMSKCPDETKLRCASCLSSQASANHVLLPSASVALSALQVNTCRLAPLERCSGSGLLV